MPPIVRQWPSVSFNPNLRHRTNSASVKVPSPHGAWTLPSIYIPVNVTGWGAGVAQSRFSSVPAHSIASAVQYLVFALCRVGRKTAKKLPTGIYRLFSIFNGFPYCSLAHQPCRLHWFALVLVLWNPMFRVCHMICTFSKNYSIFFVVAKSIQKRDGNLPSPFHLSD